jgi:hypothetical protein
MQTSLITSELPDDWLTAYVSAIYKNGKRDLGQNYRPISLTCIACKIMESIIRDKIMHHMKSNDLFSHKQYGFINGRSTTLQLLKCMEIWCDILDSGGIVDVVYLDFAKAFDTVPHNRLLGKLYSYGIRDPILSWTRSFLNNRTQLVRIGNSYSDWKPTTSGIPQGSVLGPVLFVLYINDLPDMVQSHTFLFADDTKIFTKIIKDTDQDKLQNDLSSLITWSDRWLLHFNLDKCKVLRLGNKHQTYNYELNNVELENVIEMKDLGITVDAHLKFQTHINNKIRKANTVMGCIRRTFTYLDIDHLNYYSHHMLDHTWNMPIKSGVLF